jgi:hypothetical protein
MKIEKSVYPFTMPRRPKSGGKTVLTVDWDYFFHIPNTRTEAVTYDTDKRLEAALFTWGVGAGEFFEVEVWQTRAAAFFSQGWELPQVNQEWRSFWNRFNFSVDARAWYGDCHALMMMPKIVKGTSKVLNFDAHHDAGYRENYWEWQHYDWQDKNGAFLECWAMVYHLGGVEVITYYPHWGAYKMETDPYPIAPIQRLVDSVYAYPTFPDLIDEVLIVRSSPWVAPWCDADFMRFVKLCPVKPVLVGELPKRRFSLKDARRDAKIFQELERTYGQSIF